MNIYLIGICGITMGSIAIELKRLGHTVTGSDKGIYPPMSDMLRDTGVNIQLGYKEEHILNMSIKPDLVVVANSVSTDNPEYIKCKELNYDLLSYPEVLKRFCVKDNSIVVTGTYGKTTITALLVHLFNHFKIDTSYMIGGKALNLDKMVSFNDSNWSIIEGDEYFTSKTILKSKFTFYNPKYLILTSGEWDHTDVFKTEEEYISNFVDLLKSIPNDGVIIANSNGKNVSEIVERSGKEIQTVFYSYDDTELKEYSPKVIGKHNFENIQAALILINTLKQKEILKTSLNDDEFNMALSSAINSFTGIYRRLNVLLESDKVIVIDDFAHSPSKFKATIDAAKEKYQGYDITAVIEPNMGNRTKLSLNSYTDVFKDVKKVFIPKWRINKLKEDSDLASQEDFFKKFQELNLNVELEMDDNILSTKLKDITKEDSKSLILFMGSEPFRNIPEELIKQVKEKLWLN